MKFTIVATYDLGSEETYLTPIFVEAAGRSAATSGLAEAIAKVHNEEFNVEDGLEDDEDFFVPVSDVNIHDFIIINGHVEIS